MKPTRGRGIISVDLPYIIAKSVKVDLPVKPTRGRGIWVGLHLLKCSPTHGPNCNFYTRITGVNVPVFTGQTANSYCRVNGVSIFLTSG